MADDATKAPDVSGLFQIKRVLNPNRPVIYTNNAFVMMNQWDLQVSFALVHEVAIGEFGSVDEVTVIMTPEHALAFSKALQRTLDIYASTQGAIRIIKPPEVPITPEKPSQ